MHIYPHDLTVTDLVGNTMAQSTNAAAAAALLAPQMGQARPVHGVLGVQSMPFIPIMGESCMPRMGYSTHSTLGPPNNGAPHLQSAAMFTNFDSVIQPQGAETQVR